LWRSGRRSPRRCAWRPLLAARVGRSCSRLLSCAARAIATPLSCRRRTNRALAFSFLFRSPRVSPVGHRVGRPSAHSTRCAGRWPAQAGAHSTRGGAVPCLAWPGMLRRCPRHAVPTSPRGRSSSTRCWSRRRARSAKCWRTSRSFCRRCSRRSRRRGTRASQSLTDKSVVGCHASSR
jgi:hypothetical protein